MGIPNLLPFISSATRELHVSYFSGQCVAVDASCWLHRGAISCSAKLMRGEHTTDFLKYPLAMVKMLLENGVTPLLVFDGAKLPMKARTDTNRMQQREEQMRKAKELLSSNDQPAAARAMNRTVTVTTEMGRHLIDSLKERDLPFVVAPYEADAQLVFLVLNGHCSAVISEDSDLLAYGCPHTLYKLDSSGHCRLASYDNLQFATDTKTGRLLFDGNWEDEWDDWKQYMFRDMCILAGCDYLSGIPGVGIKTAHAALRTHGDIARACSALLSSGPLEPLSADGSCREHSETEVHRQYLICFQAARDVFERQLIWDPNSQMVIPLRREQSGEHRQDMRYSALFGVAMNAIVARQVCCEASVDPITLLPVEGESKSEIDYVKPSLNPEASNLCARETRVQYSTNAPKFQPRRSSRFFVSPHNEPSSSADVPDLPCVGCASKSYPSASHDDNEHRELGCSSTGQKDQWAHCEARPPDVKRLRVATRDKSRLVMPDPSYISQDFLLRIRQSTSLLPH